MGWTFPDQVQRTSVPANCQRNDMSTGPTSLSPYLQVGKKGSRAPLVLRPAGEVNEVGPNASSTVLSLGPSFPATNSPAAHWVVSSTRSGLLSSRVIANQILRTFQPPGTARPTRPLNMLMPDFGGRQLPSLVPSFCQGLSWSAIIASFLTSDGGARSLTFNL